MILNKPRNSTPLHTFKNYSSIQLPDLSQDSIKFFISILYCYLADLTLVEKELERFGGGGGGWGELR